MGRAKTTKQKAPSLPAFPSGTAWEFTITGAPRTKKNKQRIFRRRDGTPFIANGATAAGWAQSAIGQLKSQWHRPGGIDQPVTVRALIYRDRATGDAVGYYQAIGDALQEAWVLRDDESIADWDGSRRLKDKQNPRIVVVVTCL